MIARLLALRLPVTLLVLLVSLLVALLSRFGEYLVILQPLTFSEFRLSGDYLYFPAQGDALASGQWWRLFTPMLIHFGVLHLAMNGLWFWELGRRLERVHGSLVLLALVLFYSLIANLAEFLFSGPALFGGLSGVLYGLLGHCWLRQRLAPDPRLALPSGVITLMLVWLLVCLSGVTVWLGFGAIANAAHIGGLLSGCLTGVLAGLLARRSG